MAIVKDCIHKISRFLRRHYRKQSVFKSSLAVFFLLIWLPILIFWNRGRMVQNLCKSKESGALYMIMVMVCFWITKCIPEEITCLLPVFMAPFFGILSSDDVSHAYYDEIVLFFLMSCAFGAAIEFSNFHTRLVFRTLIILGPGVSRILFGLMMVTATLSMVVSNTACTSMMLPITITILEELEDVIKGNARPFESYPVSMMTIYRHKRKNFDEQSSFHGIVSVFGDVAGKNKLKIQRVAANTVPLKNDVKAEIKEEVVPEIDPNTAETGNTTTLDSAKKLLTKAPQIMFNENEPTSAEVLTIRRNIHKRRIMFLLATAFSSNIGGTAMLVGSSANLFCMHVIQDAKKEVSGDITKVKNGTLCLESLRFNAFTWMEFNMLITIINLLSGFLFFRSYFLREPGWLWRCGDPMHKYYKSKTIAQTLKFSFKKQMRSLGPMTFHEYAVVVIVLIWIVLLLSENPNTPGWHSYFKEDSIQLSTPTTIVAIFLIFIPRRGISFHKTKSLGFEDEPIIQHNETLAPFIYVREIIPRKLFMLLGGGISMIKCFRSSGLSLVLEHALKESYFTTFGNKPVLLMLLCFGITIFTSIIPNTTASFLILPLVKEMAFVAGVHPLYFILPATTCCSYSFLLKSSSQSNSEVASVIRIQDSHFFKSGIVLLIICLSVMFLITHTIGELLFKFKDYQGYCQYTTI